MSSDSSGTLKFEPPEKPSLGRDYARNKEQLKPPGVSYYTFETSAKQIYVSITSADIVYPPSQI